MVDTPRSQATRGRQDYALTVGSARYAAASLALDGLLEVPSPS